MSFRWIFAVLSLAGTTLAQPQPHPLVWDALEKVLEVKPGDGAAQFDFRVVNQSNHDVTVTEVRPSCGCTVPEVPHLPWILAPNEKGNLPGTIDLRGKHGKISKNLFITSDAGLQVLTITIDIPDSPNMAREQNRMAATQDRQAVFKGDCARCHAAPTVDKEGAELFAAACGICHTAEHRAEMVPDLAVVREVRGAEFWRKWISGGKEGTLMPAFARQNGGPLSEPQIESLVAYLQKRWPAPSLGK